MKRTLWIIVILLLLTLMPINGQEDTEDPPNYLFEMMASIPDSENSRVDFLSYIDYDAVEQARRTPISPINTTFFNLMPAASTSLWFEARNRIVSGPAQMQTTLIAIEEMPDVVGLDYFAINRAISWGSPPSAGMMLGGEFDIEAVSQAHADRDYQANDFAGVTVWCGPNGCDSGFETNIENINPANIFDPRLGRAVPVLVMPGYLASSPDISVVEGVANATVDESDSLLDVWQYRTAAEAITDSETYSGDLIQVNFLNPDPVSDVDLTLFEDRETYEEMVENGMGMGLVPEFRAEWLEYGELPPYLLSALVDRFDGENNQAIVALIYVNEEAAQTAATELANRLSNYYLPPFGDSEEPVNVVEFVNGAVVDEPYVYHSEETGLYAAVASISYPLPEVEGETFAEGSAPPGQVYRFWIQDVYRREFFLISQVTLPDWAYEE